jgi:dihydroorotate dehydrogenase
VRAIGTSAVGLSVLGDGGEDYKELRALCESARFCELNLKYSFRSKKEKGPEGLHQFAAMEKRFEVVTSEVQRFCDAFDGIPVFIKVSRELGWLPGTDELGELIEILKHHGRAGLIVANSLKIDIPPFIAEGVEQELKGGVICGERLFDDTISLISALKKDCEGASIPIVATGGVVSPEQILTAFRAGASAVQLCTAFDYNRLNFYNTIAWYLQNRTERADCEILASTSNAFEEKVSQASTPLPSCTTTTSTVKNSRKEFNRMYGDLTEWTFS